MLVFDRILVPYDFSETSANAVRYGMGLAQAFNARVQFLYVGDSERASLATEQPVDSPDALLAAFKTAIDRTVSRLLLSSVDTQFFVRAGHPAAEIVTFADEEGADLIVMGTHGRGVVGHFVMGSVAEKVVRTAHCPVLTVRNETASRGAVVVTEAAAAEAL